MKRVNPTDGHQLTQASLTTDPYQRLVAQAVALPDTANTSDWAEITDEQADTLQTALNELHEYQANKEQQAMAAAADGTYETEEDALLATIDDDPEEQQLLDHIHQLCTQYLTK